MTDAQWAQSFELLIGGPIRILRALTPKIEGEGAVLFITSSSVRQPIPNLDTSNVLILGVAAMAKVLARELGPSIRVGIVWSSVASIPIGCAHWTRAGPMHRGSASKSKSRQ